MGMRIQHLWIQNGDANDSDISQEDGDFSFAEINQLGINHAS
jgi:hypothetical protein